MTCVPFADAARVKPGWKGIITMMRRIIASTNITITAMTTVMTPMITGRAQPAPMRRA